MDVEGLSCNSRVEGPGLRVHDLACRDDGDLVGLVGLDARSRRCLRRMEVGGGPAPARSPRTLNPLNPRTVSVIYG